MATIKSYTDLEQSKKLAEILPTESADMCWCLAVKGEPEVVLNNGYNEYGDFELPCWSLTALMNLLDDKAGLAKDYGLWFCYDNGKSHCTKHYQETIDAAFEMICWLKENEKI